MSRSARPSTLSGGAAALWIGLASHGAAAQSAPSALAATILSGTVPASGSARLQMGSRVASPPGSWTEIILSDGSSIVLGPNAALTVRQIAAGTGSPRYRIDATGSGPIRVAAMDGMEIDVATAGASVRIAAASAALNAGPHGSVTMIGGREVVVIRGARQDILRRPGFSIPFDGASPRRDRADQIVAALAPFAPSAPAPTASPSTEEAAPAPVAAAGPAELTNGLTSQSGSVVISPALQLTAAPPAAPLAPATAVVATQTQTPASPAVPVSPAVPIKSAPDLNFSGFSQGPFAGAEPPSPNPTPPTPPAPTPSPTPPAAPPTTFLAVGSVLLGAIPGTAGPINLPGTTTSVTAGLVPSSEHLVWGLFLPTGTAPTAAALAGPGLTFQITSTALPAGSLQGLTGTATYTGGLIANTTATGGTRTGQFAQSWNFGTRSGALNAVFDGSTWQAIGLTMPAGSGAYAGSGTSMSDQRSITIGGGFYNSTPVPPGSLPAATGGTFSVGASSTGRPSAGGIFVGTRR